MDYFLSQKNFFLRSNQKLIEKKQEEQNLTPKQKRLSIFMNKTQSKLRKSMSKRFTELKIESVAIKEKPHLINYFEEIGWADPYRQYGEAIPKKQVNVMYVCFEKLVYHPSKYAE